jgi:hypothetical protein
MNTITSTRNEKREQDHKGVQKGVTHLKIIMVMTMTTTLCQTLSSYIDKQKRGARQQNN